MDYIIFTVFVLYVIQLGIIFSILLSGEGTKKHVLFLLLPVIPLLVALYQMYQDLD